MLRPSYRVIPDADALVSYYRQSVEREIKTGVIVDKRDVPPGTYGFVSLCVLLEGRYVRVPFPHLTDAEVRAFAAKALNLPLATFT